MIVNSVLGPIPASQLGVTLMHEHIVCGIPGWYANDSVTPFNRAECLRVCLPQLEELRGFGVKTLVDATTNDMGRDPVLLKEVAEKSGINIVCATGLYYEAEGGSAYFRFRQKRAGSAQEEMSELFMREITQGIGSTGIRAGVIKVATGAGRISDYEAMVLRAAAQAQKQTGVPIITHTEAGTMGPEQADLLLSEGVKPGRMIGHICGCSDIKYHLAVLANGAYIAFDRLGAEHLQPDAVRLACVMAAVHAGYKDRIMLSHDAVLQWLGKPIPMRSPAHLFKNFASQLRRAGMTESVLAGILTDNPRRLFEG